MAKFVCFLYLVDEAAATSLGQDDRPRERVGVAQRTTGIARLCPNEPCFVHRSGRAKPCEVELHCKQKGWPTSSVRKDGGAVSTEVICKTRP